MPRVTDNSRPWREVLWHFNPDHPLAFKPGSFAEQLIHTMTLADAQNFERLAQTFPAYGAAVHLIGRTPGGYEVAERTLQALEEDEDDD